MIMYQNQYYLTQKKALFWYGWVVLITKPASLTSIWHIHPSNANKSSKHSTKF